MGEMTSRERVTAALRHEEPDRVPLDIGGSNCSTLSIGACERLEKHLGIPTPARAMSEIWRVADLDEEILQLLGTDVRLVAVRGPGSWTPPPSKPGTHIDEWGIKWRRAPHALGYYWEMVEAPLANAKVSDLDSYPWPDPLDPGRYDGLVEEVQRLYGSTPYALMGDPGFKQFLERAMWLRGGEQMLMDLVLNPEFVHALMEKLLEINVAATRRFLEITGPYLLVVRTADDLASQDSPLISPRVYREMVKPYHKQYYQFIRQYTDAKILLHCCGNPVPLLDDLIDAGVDIWRTVQLRGIQDHHELKSRYGDRLSFWGGIDVQQVLPSGTPAEVREEVHARILEFAPGGGYVAAATHNMQADVPPENVLAMAEAVRELGVHGLA